MLDQVVLDGQWGRAMPAGTAQGVAIHEEYKSVVAYLVEIDCREPTPRVTSACRGRRRPRGQPEGVEAQMQGVLIDGLSMTLHAGLHIDHGAVREGSFSDYRFAADGRQPARDRGHRRCRRPASRAARASSGSRPRPRPSPTPYARATGTTPTQLPDRRLRSLTMPTFTFTLNGETTTVDAPPDEPLLWVLRDVLGVTGPKYGCGVGVCKACTSHLDGAAFNPCITPGRATCAGRAGHDDRRAGRRRRRCIPCSRRGSTRTSRSAASASPARSWPRPRCSPANPHPTDADIDAAMTRTSAAAAPTSASAPPSSAPPGAPAGERRRLIRRALVLTGPGARP